jgi:hypothetical protein
MTNTKRFLVATAVASVTALSSFSADAFFGPFSWMRGGGWGPGWWGGPWGGWGYPYYGWGYPYYGWGYPYYGLGYPYYGLGYPALVAPTAVTQPSTSTEK